MSHAILVFKLVQGNCLHVCLVFTFYLQEPQPLRRQHLDHQLLARSHAGQARSLGAQCKLLAHSRGASGQKMCLLEEISTSAVVSQ